MHEVTFKLKTRAFTVFNPIRFWLSYLGSEHPLHFSTSGRRTASHMLADGVEEFELAMETIGVAFGMVSVVMTHPSGSQLPVLKRAIIASEVNRPVEFKQAISLW